VAEKCEIRIFGRAVSRGIGIGNAVCLFGTRKQFFHNKIAAAQIDTELDRFEKARAAARTALDADVAHSRRKFGDAVADILETHLLIIEDPEFQSHIRNGISTERFNAEWAISAGAAKYSSLFEKSTERQLREKHLDLEDVADRLISAIAAGTEEIRFEKGSVIAASELKASTILRFQEAGIAGIVSEHGGWTSHASILARELEIPSVTGIEHLFSCVLDGSRIAVDGFKGEVIIDPTKETETKLRSRNPDRTTPRSDTSKEGELTTLDGRQIVIRTNTASVESYKLAAENGAKGIGLYRSEGLIGKFGRIPTEDEQVDEYCRIADAAGGDGVRIRTFDIDSELYSANGAGRQRNPALGLRAVRLGLRRPELLVPQIRAILRASFERSVSIVIPMVSGTTEINRVREMLGEQKRSLENEGIRFGDPDVGAMIEVPSSAVLADQVAAVSDFVCLGTNDLAQYVLAADRDNEAVSEWFRTLHPAMLRIVKTVIESCKKAGKRLVVCGEMAGSPFYVPVLVGMGATELSVGPKSIEPVRRVVAGIAFEEAAKLFRELQKFTTPDEIEQIVTDTARRKWPHLYPADFFELNSQ
jgi:phosphotransferase system enzyme I (PtsI)